MSNDQPYDITTDSELKAAVRDETQYDSNTLPESDPDQPDLNGLLKSAKRVLALRAGVEDFYQDRGLAVALLGVTCAKSKGAVENQPVQVKNIATGDVTFRTTDGSSLQIEQYEQMTELGLAESSATDAGTKDIVFTNTFLSDT